MPGAAAAQAPRRKQAAAPGTVARKSFVGVLGAARMETAGARQQGLQAPLVGAHGNAQSPGAHAAFKLAMIARTRRIISAEGWTP